MSQSLRTIVRIRANDGTITTADVLASCRVAGYQFLIHRDGSSADAYKATYAPVGLGSGGLYSMIESAIAGLEQYANGMPDAINRALESMRLQHMPLLSSEAGIQVIEWKWREQCRFDSGDYWPVPVVHGLVYPKDHYLHLSVTKTETDMVAYTPSDAYGEADRQVRLKFGKYLRKVFPQLTDADIQSAVTAFRGALALAESPAVLKFATDRETINQVFETPMCACDSTYVSCMHGKFDDDAIRPYHVYADSPDVAVAYVLDHEKIVSRSVVSTKDHLWVRAYSVDGYSAKCEILKELLKQAGYTQGELTGNRLTKLNTRGVMLPYIDNGGAFVVDTGDYWKVVESGGDYECNQSDGTATECVSRCSGCDNPEEDCSCIYCDCCEEIYPNGCDHCRVCPVCHGCRDHGNCTCTRCSECSELIQHQRYCEHCHCDRCSECGELDDDCECEDSTVEATS